MPPFNLRNALIAGSVIIVSIHAFTGTLAWLFGAATGQQTVVFIVGSVGGCAAVWIAYFIGLFCLWLRRKQVEGDR